VRSHRQGPLPITAFMVHQRTGLATLTIEIIGIPRCQPQLEQAAHITSAQFPDRQLDGSAAERHGMRAPASTMIAVAPIAISKRSCAARCEDYRRKDSTAFMSSTVPRRSRQASSSATASGPMPAMNTGRPTSPATYMPAPGSRVIFAGDLADRGRQHRPSSDWSWSRCPVARRPRKETESAFVITSAADPVVSGV